MLLELDYFLKKKAMLAISPFFMPSLLQQKSDGDANLSNKNANVTLSLCPIC